MEANALPKGQIIGWVPTDKSSASMSKSAKKNAKRKEKRLEKIVKDSWEDDDDDDDAADGISPRPSQQGAHAAADDHNETISNQSADAAREVEKGKPDAAAKRRDDDAVAIDDELSKGIAKLDVQ